jgi:hypothetical protein
VRALDHAAQFANFEIRCDGELAGGRLARRGTGAGPLVAAVLRRSETMATPTPASPRLTAREPAAAASASFSFLVPARCKISILTLVIEYIFIINLFEDININIICYNLV